MSTLTSGSSIFGRLSQVIFHGQFVRQLVELVGIITGFQSQRPGDDFEGFAFEDVISAGGQTGTEGVIHHRFERMALLTGLFLENPGQIVINRQGRSHAGIIAQEFLMSGHHVDKLKAANQSGNLESRKQKAIPVLRISTFYLPNF
ncbi:MAG TPA: hypothetical protein VMV89_08440 [Candidatus Paceibacterota bacterium]|nr:hypothetical protein [Candidatus Paceibacterota bacterium]